MSWIVQQTIATSGGLTTPPAMSKRAMAPMAMPAMAPPEMPLLLLDTDGLGAAAGSVMAPFVERTSWTAVTAMPAVRGHLGLCFLARLDYVGLTA